MNILFFAYDFVPNKGGVQRVTDVITKELIRRGHNVFFLCGCIPQHMEFVKQLAAPIFYLHGSAKDKITLSDITRYQSIIKDNKIDVVVNQYPLHRRGDAIMRATPMVVKKIAFYHGKPFGLIKARMFLIKRQRISLSSSFSYLRLLVDLWLLKRRFTKIAKYVDKFCFLCQGNIDALCKEVKIEQDKLCIIQNPNTFSDNSMIDFSKKENKVLFVGRVNDIVKNLIGFITVWEIVSKMHEDWVAEIIGDDSNCDKYKQIIKNKGIQRISFVGHKKNIIENYKKAKICCVTSLSEGWPMVISESMSEGCVPCVYNTFGAALELIENNVSGLVIPPYETECMAEALNKLMGNQLELKKMALNAKKSISKFSVDRIADKYEALFRELCK